MSEEISQDTKFRPGPNMDLKCGEMSDTNPAALMTPAQAEDLQMLGKYIAGGHGATDYEALKAEVRAGLKKAWFQGHKAATTAQAEQIAALTEKLDSLKLAADPEDTRYWGISNREAGEIVDDLLLKDAVETATGSLVEQIAALTADNARLRDALFDISREHVDETRSTTPQLVQIAKDALSSPPADPSGLLRLVRDVLSVEWESIKLAVAYSPNISIERNSVLQEQMNDVLDALSNAQAHAARLRQEGAEAERDRIVKWAYEMAGPESYPLHAFEIEQFLKSQQPTGAAEVGPDA